MLDVVVLRLGSGMGASRKSCGEALRTLEMVRVALNMCVYPCRRDGWSFRSGHFWWKKDIDVLALSGMLCSTQ